MTACFSSSYLFAKLAIAAVNCNLPATVLGPHTPMAVFAGTMRHFCPGLKDGDPVGSKAGAMAFFSEVAARGKGTVCARIQGELEP